MNISPKGCAQFIGSHVLDPLVTISHYVINALDSEPPFSIEKQPVVLNTRTSSPQTPVQWINNHASLESDADPRIQSPLRGEDHACPFPSNGIDCPELPIQPKANTPHGIEHAMAISMPTPGIGNNQNTFTLTSNSLPPPNESSEAETRPRPTIPQQL
ncbi:MULTISPECIES: hypothetical protein [unclassified Lentimonas]|uniref:hypothetical protein n=1 Tax=unclassified Lentimonas TaxID=2630993 RepID=UPI0013213B82|nr:MULTISPECIES: hypothetical protein [unclassified Lentimonas]CAA6696242.1 Unannotated [Lentimonas sp. CC10]CAA6697495.1 Unannotated [Lentimonas sp. CC19]CAA7071232.1 Unannotated [Lentimonas sp. CC11]